MTIRKLDDTTLTGYEVGDVLLDRSLFVDVLSEGLLLTIQYTGFDAGQRGQIVLSFDDLTALTRLVNELDEVSDQWMKN
jgi:hypothetical protein